MDSLIYQKNAEIVTDSLTIADLFSEMQERRSGISNVQNPQKEGKLVKAITIRQPWASLISLGHKHFETRSWQTKYRGKLAIHAGLTVDKDACREPYIKLILDHCGLSETNLPTGKIIALCQLKGCYQVKSENDERIVAYGDDYVLFIDPEEACLGDLSIGRYAWRLEEMQTLLFPIQAKGKLSLWDCSGLF